MFLDPVRVEFFFGDGGIPVREDGDAGQVLRCHGAHAVLKGAKGIQIELFLGVEIV